MSDHQAGMCSGDAHGIRRGLSPRSHTTSAAQTPEARTSGLQGYQMACRRTIPKKPFVLVYHVTVCESHRHTAVPRGTCVRRSLGADSPVEASFPLDEPLPDRCPTPWPAVPSAMTAADAPSVVDDCGPSMLLPAAAAPLSDGRAASAA